ncbi:Segregation and condensation protein A [Aquicella siphonis]|uniref:Segregation and condensation protein A n=2 Tax=Aquicella siphonis TaxID=254247 RepID=A0A5E4PFQ0_9COXI|nr:segregation/condensation protein A [Aquicella siphonis]VVC75191.1 Segregation and condensation protein A [Aquicella siphonis]
MTEADRLPAEPEMPAASPAPAAPIATVKGQAVIDLPKDLYIPPDAMKVFLEAFEGPLDFLLYLIRKQNLDILDIPIAAVTRQYMEYIDLMQELSLELAAEYLVMAAILAEIKSRMLLPRVSDTENEEDDPRAELVRRLQEYERYKQAAEDLNLFPREERDFFIVQADGSQIAVEKPLPSVSMTDLMDALMDVLRRAELNARHHIQIDALSVREKMTIILTSIQEKDHFPFASLFNLKEGRLGVVVTFLAMLELLKQSLIDFIQAAPFAPIYLKSKTA